jgi:hypothetical protein
MIPAASTPDAGTQVVGGSLVTLRAEGEPLQERCRESRRCSRDTYLESYITMYTSIQRKMTFQAESQEVGSPRRVQIASFSAPSPFLSLISCQIADRRGLE